MGLFFDNKQHLTEMKKVYLLEKRVDKIENTLESQMLTTNPQQLGRALKKEILEDISQRWEDTVQKILPAQTERPSINLEALKEELLLEIKKTGPQPGGPPPLDHFLEKFNRLERDFQEIQKKTQEKLPPEVQKKKEEVNSQGILSTQKSQAFPPQPNPEEIHRQIKRQVQELLSSKEEVAPKAEVNRSEIEEWVENLLEKRYLPKIQEMLEKQARKVRRMERKISRLTLMITNMDMDGDDDDDDDDFLEVLSSRKKKKKGRFSSRPAEEEMKAMAPEKSAALESLFNMNLELQQAL